MGLIREGRRAPEFALKDGEGNTVRLGNFLGQKVVLYFYPKDMTEGCTVEACEFEGLRDRLRRSGAVVLGVSCDSEQRHHAFAEMHGLRFKLLADTDHSVSSDYGVWQTKKTFGQTYLGIVRTTYLIDEKGRVERVWESVKPFGHARSVLAAVRGEPEPKKRKKKAKGKKKTAKKAKKKTKKKKTAKKKKAKKKTKKKKTARRARR